MSEWCIFACFYHTTTDRFPHSKLPAQLSDPPESKLRLAAEAQPTVAAPNLINIESASMAAASAAVEVEVEVRAVGYKNSRSHG